MSGIRFWAAALVFAGFVSASAAQAMEIRQFDKMAAQDRGDYIGLLIVGSQKFLIDEGNADAAAKVENLFTQILPGDKVAAGLVEFERNLDRGRVADLERVIKDPNARRFEVEDVMAVTLKKNGIELPQSFFTANSNFHPKYPPQP